MLTSGRVITKEFIPASGGHFDKREERERERERFAQIAFTLKTLTHTHTHTRTTLTHHSNQAALRSVCSICMAIRSAYLAAGIGN